MLLRVLLALSDRASRLRVQRLLEEPGVSVRSIRSSEDLRDRVGREDPDLIVVAAGRLPGPRESDVRWLRESPGSPDLVVLLPKDEVEGRVRLRAAGCAAVLPIGLEDEQLRGVIRTILDRRRQLVAERFRTEGPRADPRLSDFVSASPAMQTFLSVVSHVVDSDASLLILGETGVGKERLARAIHAESPRGRGPFLPVNCGGFPEALLESELFGHEEGAFSGATRSRRGWIELAHGGTLFLDEIGEMPLHLQVKLLRTLQEREIAPLGGERTIRVDVRVMAASNLDLVRAVGAGRFRKDLFYRIGVVTLTLPPLRDRREDIPALIRSYIEHFQGTIRRNVRGIRGEALDALVAYDWPGNVRELMNVIERAVLLGPEEEIRLEDLPGEIVTRTSTDPPPAAASSAAPGSRPRTWAQARREAILGAERSYLAALLAETGGRVGEAARRAGLSPRSLYEKMRRHDLRKESFRPEADRTA